MKDALLEEKMLIDGYDCDVRVVFSFGDLIVFIKKYDMQDELTMPVHYLHFGKHNTDLRQMYYWLKSEEEGRDIAEIIRLIAYKMYGAGNWSNNDRRRKGLSAIQIKKFL
ncbi:hypothetical protein [Aneurinibacillus tyrosinisolvens]|uniref:hypothetical protein n=1 Tax=Aneurinibacillus tyrosinisolvens TaxID=1443435 RepID=UPI00063F687C|nr:hypothetical protein [Aneurinibacillus tyrosinisolvens]